MVITNLSVTVMAIMIIVKLKEKKSINFLIFRETSEQRNVPATT